MPVRLLAVGDIHLGRAPSRVPGGVAERVGGLRLLGPSGAWERAVEAALECGVDAVLLAGDVVEQNDDFYEAFVDLSRGVRTLLDAGVSVLGVAGNHDVEVLPRLADAVEGFRLLGRGGRWETATVAGRDGSRTRVIGWSFRSPEVRASPLSESPALAVGDTVPAIGLLHCDRDRTGSRYAPVRSRELDAAPVDAWLLGHIHRPDPLAGPRPSGYLGSLVGLDPGEPGAHGPWLVEVHGRGEVRVRQLPIAPLRWEPVRVAVDGLAGPGDVHARLTAALDALHERLAAQAYRPRAVACRITLEGRFSPVGALVAEIDASDPRAHLVHERDGIVYCVETVRSEVRPAVDIEEIAAGRDPVALLARKLIVLGREADDPERRALLADARGPLEAEARAAAFAPLGTAALGEEGIARLLAEAGWRALDALLSQHEAHG